MLSALLNAPLAKLELPEHALVVVGVGRVVPAVRDRDGPAPLLADLAVREQAGVHERDCVGEEQALSDVSIGDGVDHLGAEQRLPFPELHDHVVPVVRRVHLLDVDEVVRGVAVGVEAIRAENSAVVAEHQIELEAGLAGRGGDPADLELRAVEGERVVVEVELV